MRRLHSRPGELLPASTRPLASTATAATPPLVDIPGRFLTQGNVMPLPEGVSDREAVTAGTVFVRGQRRARLAYASWVTPWLIYGAGPIGLMHVMLCRIAGAGKLIVVDPLREDRL